MQNTGKTMLTLLCILALLLGLCSVSFAAGSDADFRYTAGKDGVTITGYTGTAANLTIPAALGGKPVTALGDGCFQGMICLKRVHVPEGVKTIGDYAFEACSALQRVYLPDSLTAIGDGAFSGCGHLTLADLQDNVARIGTGAFLCCDALVSIELSAALTELGDFAFAGCDSLARVTFAGEGLKTIPDRTFYGCASLTRAVLPETVEAIGKRAFSGCVSLAAFYHGKPLSALGAYAFEQCEKLSSVDVAAKVLPEGVFYGCGAGYFTVRAGVERIEAMAFLNSGMQQLELSETVTDIAPGAFYSSDVTALAVAEENPAYTVIDGALCTKDGKTLLAWFPADPYAEEAQTDYAVPDGVEIIAPYAFAFAPLTHITLPESLQEIGAYAFANVPELDMPIPAGVQVDPKAFDAPEDEASAAALGETEAVGSTVTTTSAAGDRSLYREEDYKDYRTISNEEFDDWCEDYLAYNKAQGNPVSQDLIPYIMRYKGEVIPHFMAMTAVQNHDPDMWAQAVSFFGDDFEQMYRMMNHGLFTELRRGKMEQPLVVYSGVYDSQLMAAAGTDTVPTRDELIDAIGTTFTDPVMISTSTDPGVCCGFSDTLFIIYASKEAMEDLGAVCMDAVVHSSENEILMAANARYRVLDVGDMTVTHQDPWDEAPVVEQRSYVRVELLGGSEAKNPFVDVAEDSFCYDAVQWAVQTGVTTGTDATHFEPNGSATRAQVVTFLWRAAGCPAPNGKVTNPFADVKDSDYYAPAVLWAVEQGITQGVDKTHFAPHQVCNRSEFATFLYRFAKSPAHGAENPFSDVAKGAFYYDAVLWAAEQGITRGTDETHFSPAQRCTRGETVTLLHRYLNP